MACRPAAPDERQAAAADSLTLPAGHRPVEAFDTAAVERAADSVRVIRVEPDTLRLRVGERLPQPRAWALDAAGRDVVGFVPLWSPPDGSLIDRQGIYWVARRPGRTVMRVRPMRGEGRRGAGDPEALVAIVVEP